MDRTVYRLRKRIPHRSPTVVAPYVSAEIERDITLGRVLASDQRQISLQTEKDMQERVGQFNFEAIISETRNNPSLSLCLLIIDLCFPVPRYEIGQTVQKWTFRAS